MLLASAIALAAIATFHRDTTVILGTASRDLTGDGTPESLRLVGVGPSVDSLVVTLTIDDGGRTIYRSSVHLASRAEYDRRLRAILGMDYRGWLKDVGAGFFAEARFMKPEALLNRMRASIPGHVAEIPNVIARDRGIGSDSLTGSHVWSEIQRAAVTLFEFAAGADAVTAIGWSRRDGRFYRLYECC